MNKQLQLEKKYIRGERGNTEKGPGINHSNGIISSGERRRKTHARKIKWRDRRAAIVDYDSRKVCPNFTKIISILNLEQC